MISQLNSRAKDLLEFHRAQLLDALGVKVHSLANGAELFDFGRTTHSGAGDLLAKVCMADLADVSYLEEAAVKLNGELIGPDDWKTWVDVETGHPLVSCMAAQYAGWPLSVGDYFAMCSGPARSARGKEKVLEEFKLTCSAENVVAVLESGSLPDEAVAEAIAAECNVSVDRVQICVAPTSSLAGTIQIVARSVETAIHKLHELNFDLSCIQKGRGRAPCPPIVASNDLVALGWTNDAVLYGAIVELTVDCEDDVLKEIGPRVPSCSSSDFGAPFIETFERFDRDFYKIDKMLFSPARIVFKNSRSNNSFSFGELRFDVLNESWKVPGDS